MDRKNRGINMRSLYLLVLLPILSRLRGISYEMDDIAKIFELAGFERDAKDLREVAETLRCIADSRLAQIIIDIDET